MSIEEKKKSEIAWYDNPNHVTSFIIGLIALIVILSQSFAINNHLSAMEILSSILNHNIVYLLMCVYFVALKTKTGKKYFDFLNVFIIVLHALTAITSLLTLFQSFGLSSLLTLSIDLLVLIFMFHTFFRSTRVWKSMSLNKSPFNEISNNGYFGSILVLVTTLLAVNLISTTSFDGTVLAIMDAAYTILFVRYIFLYGEYLNSKKISINNIGNFDEIKEKIADEVNDFVEEHELEEKFENVKEKLVDFKDDIKDKANDLKEDIGEKILELELDEKFDTAKEAISNFTENVKEELVEVKDDIKEKLEETKIEEKIVEVVDEVKESIKKTTKNVSSKPKSEITSRNKNTKKVSKKNESTKKGNK